MHAHPIARILVLTLAGALIPVGLRGQTPVRGETFNFRSNIDALDPGLAGGSDPRAADADSGAADSIAARLDQRIPALLEAAEIPGLAIALVSDGAVVWQGAYGVRSTATGQPVTDRTVFQAASLSKPVFAYTVMRLAERGEIDLDRPLYEYLPNSRMAPDPRYRRITARMVLSHSTGLPNWGGDTLTLAFEPGTAFRYSGEGYVYLQQVVESLTGQPLDALARQEVLDPLGMSRSSYVWRDDFEADAAAGHDAVGRAQSVRRYQEPNAAYSLLTTAGDYARFVAAVLGGRGLAPETAREMLTPALIAEKLSVPDSIDSRIAWALGWGVQDDPTAPPGAPQDPTGPLSYWHWGDNGVFRAFVAAYPERDLGLVYFANSIHGLAIAQELARVATGSRHLVLDWADYEAFDDPVRVARRSLFHAFADSGLDRGAARLAEVRRRRPGVFDPGFADDVASLLSSAGHPEAALRILETARSVFPVALPIRESLARVQLDAGRFADAAATLESLAESTNGARAGRYRDQAAWAGLRARTDVDPVRVPAARLRRLAGDYGPRHITLEDGTLYYQRDGNPRYRLVPLGDDVFQPVGIEQFRIRFEGAEDGVPTGITGLYFDGTRDETPRSS